jgi:hypothetical protein
LQEVYELRLHTLGAAYTSRGSNVHQKHLDLKASYSLREKIYSNDACEGSLSMSAVKWLNPKQIFVL